MKTIARTSPGNFSVGQMDSWGSFLAGGALLVYGLTRRSLEGILIGILGGSVVYRAVTRRRHRHWAMGARSTGGIRVSEAVTIAKPPADLYRHWRNFENLPRIMDHLKSVTLIDDHHSHWVAKGPAGMKVAWDAEIVQEISDELISWQSFDNADVRNAGSVSFRELPEGRGTEVKVILRYDPPGGTIGTAFARLFGEEPSRQIRDDLHRFKQIMETGETAAVEGQSAGRPG